MSDVRNAETHERRLDYAAPRHERRDSGTKGHERSEHKPESFPVAHATDLCTPQRTKTTKGVRVETGVKNRSGRA